MKTSEFRKLIREEVRKVLSEAVDLKATGNNDVQLIISYLNSIGIKPVYPRYFYGSFDTKRELIVDLEYRKMPSKQYEALQTNQTKFKEVLTQANVPTPVLVGMFQINPGDCMLIIYNGEESIKKALKANQNEEGFKYFIIK